MATDPFNIGINDPLFRPKRRRRQTQYLTPADEESLVAKAGRNTISGVGAVANLLDLPGSMIRDVATLNNPLDQLLSPFSDKNRVTGRQMLRQYGLVGPRDTWGNFGGGLAAEIALDPLTYLTAGASALGKGGSILKSAGLLDEAAKVAGTGARQARMLTTPRQVIQAGGMGAARKAARAAKAAGVRLRDVADEPLGGLLRVGIPGTSIGGTIGKAGGRAEKIAQGLDIAGEAVRYGKYSPVRALGGAFDYATKGMTSAPAQRIAREATKRERQAVAGARETIAPLVRTFDESGLFDAARAGSPQAAVDNSIAATKYLEESGIGDSWNLPEHMQSLAPQLDQMKQMVADIRQRELAAGLPSPDLDDIVRYFPRTKRDFAIGGKGGGVDKLLDTSVPNFIGRKAGLKGHVEGTALLQRMSVDPAISGITHTLGGGKLTPDLLESVRQHIAHNYPGVAGTMVDKEWDQLARTIANLDPRHAKQGIPMFELNPVKALQSRVEHGERAIAASGMVQNILLKNAVHRADAAALSGLKAPETIRDVLTRAGLGGEKITREADRIAATADNLSQGDIVHALDQNNFGTVQSVDNTGAMVRFTNPQHGTSATVHLTFGQLEHARPPKIQTNVAQQSLLNRMKADGGLLERLGMTQGATEEVLSHLYVPKDVAADVTRFLGAFTRPEETQPLVAALDAFTNWFKSGVTALWPAFHARNFISGQFQNYIGGAFDPTATGPMRYLQPIKDAHDLMRGKAIKGMSIEDTRKIADQAFAHEVIGRHHGQAGEVIGDLAGDMAGDMPGLRKEIFSKPDRSIPFRQRIAPWNVRGVAAKENVLGAARWGEDVAHWTEGLNRLAPFVAFIKQGMDPAEAAKRVKLLQVDYGALSRFERGTMRRLLPFYSFSKGTLPFLLEELTERPGKKLGQTLRAMNRARDPGAMAPDYVSETAAIPLPGGPEGGQRYLTGFGLMPEDPLSFAGGGMRGALLEAGSRLNPAVKGPLEWMTGQSFFQKGPTGGRELEDLDPTIGRTLANLTGRDQPVRTPASLEFILGNSPAARALTTTRTLTDPRKGLGAKAANLLTGFRVSDVSPAAQDAILREQIQDMMRGEGAKVFEKAYFPDEALESLSPKQRTEAERLEAMLNVLGQRRKQRAATTAK